MALDVLLMHNVSVVRKWVFLSAKGSWIRGYKDTRVILDGKTEVYGIDGVEVYAPTERDKKLLKEKSLGVEGRNSLSMEADKQKELAILKQ